MYRVSGDWSGEDERELEATSMAVKAFPRRIQTVVGQAVRTEKSTHKYTNRTHDAEDGTQMHVREIGGDASVVAIMDVEYASFLNARGWSRFDELMERAEERLDAEYDRTFDEF